MLEARTGRYSIGQEIYVCLFVYGWGVSILQPYMYNDELPTDIKFVKLTVKEHHLVPGEWDDKIQYDGYILTADDGTIFTNQYPRASYGQMSDRGDRVFYVDFRGKKKADFKKMVDIDANAHVEYVTINEVFTPMFKAATLDKNRLPDALGVKLSYLIDCFNKKFETAFPGKQLETTPLRYKTANGEMKESTRILETIVIDKIKKED